MCSGATAVIRDNYRINTRSAFGLDWAIRARAITTVAIVKRSEETFYNFLTHFKLHSQIWKNAVSNKILKHFLILIDLVLSKDQGVRTQVRCQKIRQKILKDFFRANISGPLLLYSVCTKIPFNEQK